MISYVDSEIFHKLMLIFGYFVGNQQRLLGHFHLQSLFKKKKKRKKVDYYFEIIFMHTKGNSISKPT